MRVCPECDQPAGRSPRSRQPRIFCSDACRRANVARRRRTPEPVYDADRFVADLEAAAARAGIPELRRTA